jgi:hypothetical protein
VALRFEIFCSRRFLCYKKNKRNNEYNVEQNVNHPTTSFAIIPPQAQATANQLMSINILAPHLLHIANALTILRCAAVNIFTASRDATLAVLLLEVNASGAS